MPIVSTFLVRTLVDERYFHAIRSSAAASLVNQAKDETNFLGLYHLLMAFNHLYSSSDPNASSANDFSDRAAYYVRCSIVRAIGKARNNAGRSPIAARKFLYAQLRGNDNSDNEVSDCNYVALLMRSLAEACASAPMPDDDDMMVDLEEGDNWRFQRDCIEEIDRHRRTDEWIPSYHNALSEAALDCAGALARANLVPRSPLEFIQYTREGANELLRVAAFRNLMELGFLKEDYLLRWFMFVLGHDTSPSMRFSLLRLFGIWLGNMAIGKDYHELQKKLQLETHQSADGLVIEQDSVERRKADLERKSTIPGARSALQAILAEQPMLKDFLWLAMNSPIVTLAEISDLLIVCGLLYEPHTAMTIKLKYPRYYKAVNKGHIPAGNGMKKKHIVAFVPTRPRTTKMPKPLQIKAKTPLPPPSLPRDATGKPTLVLKLKPNLGHPKAMPPPSTASGSSKAMSPAGSGTPGEDGKPKFKIKLKVGGALSPPGGGSTPR